MKENTEIAFKEYQKARDKLNKVTDLIWIIQKDSETKANYLYAEETFLRGLSYSQGKIKEKFKQFENFSQNFSVGFGPPKPNTGDEKIKQTTVCVFVTDKSFIQFLANSPNDANTTTDLIRKLLNHPAFKDKIEKHTGLKELKDYQGKNLLGKFLEICESKKCTPNNPSSFFNYLGRDSDVEKLYELGRKYKNNEDFKSLDDFLNDKLESLENKKTTLSREEVIANYFTFK